MRQKVSKRERRALRAMKEQGHAIAYKGKNHKRRAKR
jgi:hypothetical protein